MRKNLFFCLMLMASTLTIGLLAGCSEEVTVNNKDGDDPQLPVVCEDATVFASGTDSTRTSIYIVDGKALFYWVKKDNIWVDENGDNQFLLRSDTSELDNNNRFANFLFKNKNLSDPTYNLTYTGNGSTSGTKVTIKKQQEQKVKNNSEHIGTSGDCGVATAVKEKGKYSFNLQHKAHYLIFQPSKDPFINGKLGVKDTWTLTSIDIVDLDGIPLSGTFSFSMEDGLDQTQEIENANDSVTLNCGTTGFELPEPDEVATKGFSCYAVIAPAPNGQDRNLKIRYNIQSKNMTVNGQRWYYNNSWVGWRPQTAASLPIIRHHYSFKCKPNGVSRFKHLLGKNDDFEDIPGEALTFSSNVYYTWDADSNYYIWKGKYDDPYPSFGDLSTNPSYVGFGLDEKTYNNSTANNGTYDSYQGYMRYVIRRYHHVEDSEEPRHYNDVVWPEEGDTPDNWDKYQAKRSCKNMPDVNAASWYVMAGDPRYEKEKIWCVNGNYRYVYTTGAWFLKWNEIPGKPEGSTITNCPRSYDGTDYRTTPMSSSPLPFAISDRTNSSGLSNPKPATDYKKGRPSPSEIHKYFFLPSLGQLHFTNRLQALHWQYTSLNQGHYWLSSAYPQYSWVPFTNNNVIVYWYNSLNTYSLVFREDAIFVNSRMRDGGLPAGKRKRAGGVQTDDDWFQ